MCGSSDSVFIIPLFNPFCQYRCGKVRKPLSDTKKPRFHRGFRGQYHFYRPHMSEDYRKDVLTNLADGFELKRLAMFIIFRHCKYYCHYIYIINYTLFQTNQICISAQYISLKRKRLFIAAFYTSSRLLFYHRFVTSLSIVLKKLC